MTTKTRVSVDETGKVNLDVAGPVSEQRVQGLSLLVRKSFEPNGSCRGHHLHIVPVSAVLSFARLHNIYR